MKIVKIGTFDHDGNPTGWHIDMNDIPDDGYALGVGEIGPGIVDVNGIEIVEWTKKRKMRMMRGKYVIPK